MLDPFADNGDFVAVGDVVAENVAIEIVAEHDTKKRYDF